MGSRGLPGKNRQRIGGFSLVEHAIRAAQRSGVCDAVVVSSDDPVILGQAKRRGAIQVRRPKRLAGPTSLTSDVIAHAVAAIERETGRKVDPVILLEPTTPLRAAADIRRAFALNAAPRRPNVASLTLVKEAAWLFKLGRGQRIAPLRGAKFASRRQDSEAAYAPNGAVYVLTRSRLEAPWYKDAVGYVTPRERSIDVDTAEDLGLVRAVHGKLRGSVGVRR